VNAQRRGERRVRRFGGGALRHNDDVEAVERGLVHTERFSDLALDTVANDRVARHPPRDGDAEAGGAGRGNGRDDEKSVSGSVLRPLPYRLELGCAPKAAIAPEAQPRR